MHLDVYGDTLCALVTAAGLASVGHDVTLRLPYGRARERVLANHAAYSEPGLRKLISSQHTAGRLSFAEFSTLPDENSRAVFLALNTGDETTAENIVQRLTQKPDRRWLIINQSPFPVGFTELLQSRIKLETPENKSAVVCLPDFLQEGSAIDGLRKPSQIILGCSDGHAELKVKEIYRPFSREVDRFLVMTEREAEFTKLTITGMLVTRISFMNDMANLADSLGVDIEHVRQGVAADPRIGPAYLYPGVGFGGPGFANNVVNLVDTLKASGVGSELLTEVLQINERQKDLLFRKLWKHYRTDLKGRTIGIWGAAFKPGTGRIDNAPVLRVLEALWAQGARVQIHDPEAIPALLEHYGSRADLVSASNPYTAAEGTDGLMVLTHWPQYGSPDFERLRQLMRSPVLLDGRNIYDPATVREYGFTYYGVGR